MVYFYEIRTRKGLFTMGYGVLYRNPEVDALHQRGLEAEIHGDLPPAKEILETAYYRIGRQGSQLEPNEAYDQVASRVHEARILRDLSFTNVRAGVADTPLRPNGTPADSFSEADRLLTESLNRTNYYIAQDSRAFVPRLQNPTDTVADARRELYAEHGATIGLMARMLTASRVVLGGDTASVLSSIEANNYQLAHTYLHIGNNGYYRVSNAVNATRRERALGNSKEAAVWYGRVLRGLEWTAAHDRSNLKDAVLTAGSRTLQMRSRGVATKSVITAP